MLLKNKVVIVTGSSRGIGKSIALRLAQEGVRVVVTARSVEKGRLPGTIYETQREIQKSGGTAIAIRCDVSDEGNVNHLVSEVIREFGNIDMLINNAAVAYYKRIVDTPLKHWDLVMRVNLRGPFICSQAVLPYMAANKRGSIVNISSYAAQDIYSRMKLPGGQKRLSGCAYGASKAALERFSRGLAEEVRENNIAVNALTPAVPTFSEGVSFWNPDVNQDELVSPQKYMTKAAVFLAQQDASGVTGGVFTDQELCQKYNLL